MKIFTEEQLLEQTLSTGGTREVIYKVDGFDQIETLQHSLYQCSIKEAELSPGLSLKITKATCFSPINCEVNHDNFNLIASKFYISGYHGVICSKVKGVAENYTEMKGQNYLFYLPNIREIEQYFPNETVNSIAIYAEIDFLRNFCSNLESVPIKLQPLIEKGKSPCFHLPIGKILPAMQTVLWQIMATPYKGILQRMYLESKILELLVLQLAQLLENETSKQKVISLNKSEIDKIYQAKEILINNLAEPPTLMNLAQQVEIHHMKLKQGFRELFGTTPFSYLRNYRMEMARNILLESKSSVLSVASAVGYSNSSHFAAAFKQKFGISPKACKLRN
ncbi:DNA-binding domain-containing protein, AraC-type [Hyella patelloides LEGE 07179]|uniref:DNA-binding domain-containing protein, AraC-type n=1 Tax=Hyella patelloides LEGE 07179 TaxID=945734 RepID=A0A563W5B8_9CYAN|nr:AraC family transcriptional regulator [Hyella patelloides]VEP18866.1 DNA-binding domain-containing protein, AraC-type [Hyella patelloides LEGE 07179]